MKNNLTLLNISGFPEIRLKNNLIQIEEAGKGLFSV